MKRRIWVVSAAAIATTLLLIVSLLILPQSAEHKATNKTLSIMTDPLQEYTNAVSSLDTTRYGLMVNRTKQTVTQKNIYTETSQLNVSVSGWGTDELCAASEEAIDYGTQTTRYCEYFTEGAAYMSVDENLFLCNISADTFSARLIPQFIIDTSLYQSVTGFDSDGEKRVIFEQPTGPEIWAIPAGAEFLGSRAVARISAEGTLLQSAYSATYSLAGAKIHITAVSQNVPHTAPVVPENLSSATVIDHPDIPRLLEQSSGYLLQADDISSVYTESIYCQAFGDQRTKESIISLSPTPDWSAAVDTEVVSTNTGHIGEIARHTHVERFSNGEYSLSIDGAEAKPDSSIDRTAMEKYCQNLLLSSIIMPQYIVSTEYTVQDNLTKIRFIASEEFAKAIATSSCQTLYEKPELLDHLTQSYKTATMECYLDVDTSTGLPTGAGILYAGIYTIDGIPYQLKFQAGQSFQ